MARGHGLLLGGSGLALACTHRREREVERWVRTPGTAGIGGPARLLLLHNRGSWHSHRSGAPAQPGEASAAALCPPGAAAPLHWQSPGWPAVPLLLGSRPVCPSWPVGHRGPQGETPLNRPGAAAAGEAGWLTFMQGHEQGQSEGAPGSGHGNHSGGGVQGWTGAGSRECACCLRPAAKRSQADSSLPPCPGCL